MLDASAPLTTPTPQAEVRVQALIARAEQMRLDGDYLGGREPAQQAVALATEIGSLHLRADGMRLLTLLIVRTHDYEAAVRTGRQALALQRETRAAVGEVETLSTLALACTALALYQDALTYSAAAIAGATRLADDRLLCWALSRAGCTHIDMHKFDEAERLLAHALELARGLGAGGDEEFGVLHNIGNLHSAWATALKQSGHLKESLARRDLAVQSYLGARSVAQRGLHGPKQCLSIINMLPEQIELGHLEDAAANIAACRELAQRDDVSWLLPDIELAQAKLLLSRGEAATALLQLEQLRSERSNLNGLQNPRLNHLMYLAHKQTGQFDKALAYHEKILDAERAELRNRADAQTRLMMEQLAVDQAHRDTDRARAELRAQTSLVARLEGERRVLEVQATALNDAANKDALTGLANRRFADEILGRLQAQRGGAPWCLVMADVDHFKRVNDSFGHPMGDRVLQTLAQLLRAGTRDDDMVVRWGGEEFVLLLIGAPISVGQASCERLRGAVQTYDWSLLAPGLAVTISFGIGEVGADETVPALLHRVDAALYCAKRKGRNCAVVAEAS